MAVEDLKYQKLITQVPLDSFHWELFTWAFSFFRLIAVASRYRKCPEIKQCITEKLFWTFKLGSETQQRKYRDI